tara:strand:- start:459 stop:1358 length:900 start_codon:yes stop_codon:yes gene_type:complete
MKNKIMITGGTGLVGSSLKGDIKINSKDADLRKWDDVKKIFQLHQPTHVVHCAAKVGGLGSNMNYKGEFFYDNIMINTNIIEACRIFNIKKLVCFLSTCIFPDNIEYPLTEQKIHLGKPHESNYPYAYAKRMADIQLRAYREQYGLKYISVIPTNIYGPNDNFSISNGHVIPSLIHKCYLAKQNNESFRVWGTGTPLREFIYSKDIANLTTWALENYSEEEPIIFTTSNEVSIGHIAYLIAKQMDYTDNIIFESDKPDGQFRKPSSNLKLKKYLPEYKFTPIEKGIEETVKWFIKNYKK